VFRQYFSVNPSSVTRVLSLFMVSKTGSMRIASFVAVSASRYVYVLLSFSNSCRKKRLDVLAGTGTVSFARLSEKEALDMASEEVE
jgi:hypothetical protein